MTPRLSRRFCLPYATLFALIVSNAVCDSPPEPPPVGAAKAPTKEAARIEPDVTKNLTIKLDQEFMIPNLVFQIEKDAADPKWMEVVFATSRPSPLGVRIAFSSIERTRSWEELKSFSIDYAAGDKLNRRGDGIFTATGAYQPKLVSIQVDSYDETSVTGRIFGKFYKFEKAFPTAEPEVIEAEGKFVAAKSER